MLFLFTFHRHSWVKLKNAHISDFFDIHALGGKGKHYNKTMTKHSLKYGKKNGTLSGYFPPTAIEIIMRKCPLKGASTD